MKTLVIFLFSVASALAQVASVQGPCSDAGVIPCFYTTSWNTGSSSYVGNAMTHSEINGNNYFIFDGPAFYVATTCTSSKVAFLVTMVDGYKSHYVCQGGAPPLANNGASCTTCTGATCGPITTGVCRGGASCSNALPNTYDVGVYCIGGGNCIFGQLYAHVGALAVYDFFDCAHHATQCATFGQVANRYILTLDWKTGPTILPTGNYAIGMATSCDDGRQPVRGRGYGDTKCGAGAGEGGPYGYNGYGGSNPDGRFKAGTQLLPFKYFTEAPNTPSIRCLTYNDVTGLPDNIGVGSACNFSSIPVNGAGQAPHILNFAIF
jgi:hypothetical protein